MMAARTKVDLSKEGHGQRCSVQTQLSNQCTYTCVCVHTHSCLLPPSLQGFVAEALINSQPLLTLQRASISQHTLFPQIPEPSLKKRHILHSFSFPLLILLSIYTSISLSGCSLVSHFKNFNTFDCTSIVFAC